MKAVVLILALAVPALAQTQSEMNAEAAADFAKADRKLNAAYQKLKADQDESGQALLKAAQRAWLAYRDAEAALEAAPSKGGSIYPLVVSSAKTRLTEARTKELQAILDGPDSSGEKDADDDPAGTGDPQR